MATGIKSIIVVVGCAIGISVGFNNLFADQSGFAVGEIDLPTVLQSQCKVARISHEWADLDCSGEQFKQVAQNCDVLLEEGDLSKPHLMCRGKAQNWVQAECKVWMNSVNTGTLACTDTAKARVKKFLSYYEADMLNRR